jgi:GDP-mannose transporter
MGVSEAHNEPVALNLKMTSPQSLYKPRRNFDEDVKEEKQADADDSLTPLISCLCYSFCSLSTVLTNKMLNSSFEVDITKQTYSLAMLAFQSYVASMVLGIAYFSGFTSEVKMSVSSLTAWFPVTVCFVAMLFTGFVSLGHNSVPMVTLFKNLTNILTVFGDWYWHGQTASWGVIGSLGLMIAGAVLSAWSDLDFEAKYTGYLWMIANCVSTSAFVLYLSHVTKTLKDLTTSDKVLHNNILSAVSITSILVATGEVDTILKSSLIQDTNFWMVASVSGLVGGLLNFASFWCVQKTSATTYATVGALNKVNIPSAASITARTHHTLVLQVPLVGLGFWLFDDVLSEKQLTFVTFGILGGMLYSFVKFREGQAARKAKAASTKGNLGKSE